MAGVGDVRRCSSHSSLWLSVEILGERQSISKGIGHRHVVTAPWHRFYGWLGVSILLRRKLPLKSVQIGRFDPHGRAGTAVAMMFRQMKNAAILRDLHVEREMRLKAMLPIQPETQEVEIEFLRPRFVEYAQDGDGCSQLHGSGLYDEFESLVMPTDGGG